MGWYELPTYSALKAAREGRGRDNPKKEKQINNHEEIDEIWKEMCSPSDEEECEERDVHAKLLYLDDGILPANNNNTKIPSLSIPPYSSSKGSSLTSDPQILKTNTSTSQNVQIGRTANQNNLERSSSTVVLGLLEKRPPLQSTERGSLY